MGGESSSLKWWVNPPPTTTFLYGPGFPLNKCLIQHSEFATKNFITNKPFSSTHSFSSTVTAVLSYTVILSFAFNWIENAELEDCITNVKKLLLF